MTTNSAVQEHAFTVEDRIERIVSSLDLSSADFFIEIQQAQTVTDCLRIRDRIARCLAVLEAAESAAREKSELIQRSR